MEERMKIWEGKNSDGDIVTLSDFEDGLGVSFDNKEDGYGGATVIPKIAYESIEKYFNGLVSDKDLENIKQKERR